MSTRMRVWLPEKPQSMPEPNDVIPISIGHISGHYDIELLDKQGNVLNSWSFDNIITNTGMDAIGSTVTGESNELFNFMQTGAGSTTPSGTDTGLASAIAGRVTYVDVTGSNILSDSSGSYYTRRLTYFFNETVANGNITEVGIFTLATGGRLVNRALIRDNLGVPTTITKTSDNQLRVFYTYRVYVPLNDVTGTITLAGIPYNYTIRPQAVSESNAWGVDTGFTSPTTAGGYTREISLRSWGSTRQFGGASPSGNLVAVTGTLSLTNVDPCDTVTAQTYVNGNYYRDVDYIWEPASANFGSTGIRMLRIRGIGNNGNANPSFWTHQIQFTPNIPKTNLQRLTLRFRFGWTRSATSE